MLLSQRGVCLVKDQNPHREKYLVSISGNDAIDVSGLILLLRSL